MHDRCPHPIDLTISWDSTWVDSCNFDRYSHCDGNGTADFVGQSYRNCLNAANLVRCPNFVG